MKACKKCNVEHDKVRCPACMKATRARNYQKNKERIKAESAAWRLANPERARESVVAWQAANPERFKESAAAYRAANPERARDRTATWKAANPEAARMHCINRRARKIEVGGRLSAGLVDKLKELQKGKCACCGDLLGDDFHLDHIMPIALGGSNTDDNIQLLRGVCNLQKHAKHPVDFMQSKGYLL